MRDSFRSKLRDLLEMEAKGTICSDPFVHFPGFVDAEEAVRRADVLVVATPHEQYKTLQLHGKPVFDIWNVFARARGAGAAGVVKVLLTGSSGFIAGYLVNELLAHGHEVVGIDNFSKYGPVKRSYDSNPRYSFVEADAKDVALLNACFPTATS